VCYLIGLSGIDPVAHNLFLGRFLTETLASVPDIDLDFPREIREELILEVYQRYGAEHAGLVCTYPTYRLRSAVREVGKALDLPTGEIEQVARLADARRGAGALAEELEQLPGFAGRSAAPLWRELCEMSEEIAGLPRHVSQHVGGMIISSRPLVDIVPLERAAMPGRVVCQWDKDSCDDARFIKIDFLALGMLSLVEECVELVAERTGTAPDLTRIDFEDTAVYDRIIKGDTVGLFQIESRAQIQMIKRVRPRNVHDLAIQVAIVRPGPIVGGAVNPYVKRREALRRNPSYRVPYAHPLLEEALGETLGVIIFQDQVLKVAQALAGFTTGQAEALRRAMSRRRSHELLASFWDEFRAGALANRVDEDTAAEVFKQIVAFSQFGFPKSHAAAFALLAYQSAWLRHYYPVEYYAALFDNQPMGFYSLDALGRDAQRCGVDVLLPHVNRSGGMCRVETGDVIRGAQTDQNGSAVRVGLAFLRDWGLEAAERVVAERERNGPFSSLSDFIRRTTPVLTRPAFENLVWVGGCDEFGLTRRELLWQVGLWLPMEDDGGRSGAVGGARRRSGAVRGGRGRSRWQLELPLNQPFEHLRFRGLELDERVLAEYETLGFSMSAHPLALLREHVPPAVVRSDRLSEREDRSTIEVAGLVVARQRPETAHGTVFVLLEDEAGMVNVIVRPKVFEQYRVVIKKEPFLWMKGKLAKDDGVLNVIAEEVESLHVEIGSSERTGAPAEKSLSTTGVDPYEFLTNLRRVPPDAKEWG
jgi:error-prone DNA polymerase